jgi:hypothetical protein
VLLMITSQSVGHPCHTAIAIHELLGPTESVAEWRAAGPSSRAARSAAAGGWNARPDADSVQPTVHQYPSIPPRVATGPFHPVSTPSAACGRLNDRLHPRRFTIAPSAVGCKPVLGRAKTPSPQALGRMRTNQTVAGQRAVAHLPETQDGHLRRRPGVQRQHFS